MTQAQQPQEGTLQALLEENRIFMPPDSFKEQAVIADESLYEMARNDPDAFWSQCDEVNKLASGLKSLGIKKGERIAIYIPMIPEAAFVILKEGNKPDKKSVENLRGHVSKKIGAIAKPKTILFTAELPKTRSGKIMRRLLRDIAKGRALGDVTTLAGPAVIKQLKEKYEDS